jgi:nicotinate-nucleotide--dimethylbenzimidazole phosphoribosyltransferase
MYLNFHDVTAMAGGKDMGIYVNPGKDNFERTIRSEIYVDKTGVLDYTNSVLGTEQG